MNKDSSCPRCGEGKLTSWDQLKDDEREIVRRLPASASHGVDERKLRHRWCIRCWHEETKDTPRLV